MSKIRVGVVRGGPSCEYYLSLQTGGQVLQHLPEETYQPVDIFIAKDGVWHVRGFEVTPRQALEQVDVVFNALHGQYGEDGTIQRIFSAFRKPYTGSDALPASSSLNKALARERLSHLPMRVPYSLMLKKSDDVASRLFEVFRSFPQPSIVKPANRGSSIGVSLVDSLPTLQRAVEEAFSYSPAILIEEYVQGREATCGVVEDYRGEEYYPLFPAEIKLPDGASFLDFTTRHNGAACSQCPGSFTWKEKQDLQKLAQSIHTALGFRHYSSADFIVTSRGIYFLEADALPSLAPRAVLPQALIEGGCGLSAFLDHLVTLALQKK